MSPMHVTLKAGVILRFAIMIIINFMYIASISLTVLGALQYHALQYHGKKLDTDLVINQEKAW